MIHSRRQAAMGLASLLLPWLAACQPAPPNAGGKPPPPASASLAAPAPSGPHVPTGSAATESTAPPCPPPKPTGYGPPPWEVDQHFDECIRGPEGRWQVHPDPSDADGWRHTLRFDGADGSTWQLEVISPVGLAWRLDGYVVLLDLKDHATLISPTGSVSWRKSFPDCGHVEQMAVGWDDTVVFTCGYSVVRLTADGELAWHKWPFGNHTTGGPWVDRAGTIYLTGAGSVAAVEPSGDIRWKVGAGFNRALGRLMWSPAGHLVFDTSMNELHSDPSESGGYSFYYDDEPNELVAVTRQGKVLWRKPYEGDGPAEGWPEVLEVPSDGAHRAPQ